jgi:hypothetical protein
MSFRRERTEIVCNLSQEIEWEGTRLNLLYETSIALMLKSEKDKKRTL